jgi:acyl dehydratase
MLEVNVQNSDERFYLDDLFVGQRFTSRTHVIDEAQIKAFARQFDPQPFHQDEDNAKATLFGGLVASGGVKEGRSVLASQFVNAISTARIYPGSL